MTFSFCPVELESLSHMTKCKDGLFCSSGLKETNLLTSARETGAKKLKEYAKFFNKYIQKKFI